VVSSSPAQPTVFVPAPTSAPAPAPAPAPGTAHAAALYRQLSSLAAEMEALLATYDGDPARPEDARHMALVRESLDALTGDAQLLLRALRGMAATERLDRAR
jgi:hypothetical protein